MVVRGFEGRYRVVIWFPARSCAAGPQLATYPIIPTGLFDCICCFISLSYLFLFLRAPLIVLAAA